MLQVQVQRLWVGEYLGIYTYTEFTSWKVSSGKGWRKTLPDTKEAGIDFDGSELSTFSFE